MNKFILQYLEFISLCAYTEQREILTNGKVDKFDKTAWIHQYYRQTFKHSESA